LEKTIILLRYDDIFFSIRLSSSYSMSLSVSMMIKPFFILQRVSISPRAYRLARGKDFSKQ
jgi:hypothetical protein